MLDVRINHSMPDFNLAIDLSVDKEILSILGPSGSGKTMTLLSIAGLLRPDSGSISLNGRTLFCSTKKIFLPPQQRRIGFVFQNYALFPHLTVAENIAYGMHGQLKAEIHMRVDNLLELINIPGLKSRYPHEIS
ncbi:MAG: ATP-binding cassette domain-containing protein, partial [Dethiobacteria bacterium]|nr:ATP-binding cassette domain-containing protein [Dethiobacteria bacterium]